MRVYVSSRGCANHVRNKEIKRTRNDEGKRETRGKKKRRKKEEKKKITLI